LTASYAAVLPGTAAPDFTLTAVDGEAVSLSQFRGKYVILEWFNSECPFVQKHYKSGNMQNLQSRYKRHNVIWLSINSTNPEHSNYRDPQRSRDIISQWKAKPTALLLDPDGKVGKAYAARTTPHRYIIDPQGTLVYRGGIDDKPSFSPSDIPSAKTYVAAAFDELLSGQHVSDNDTRPYGCSVKYRY
jgi:peroxiredoxin